MHDAKHAWHCLVRASKDELYGGFIVAIAITKRLFHKSFISNEFSNGIRKRIKKINNSKKGK